LREDDHRNQLTELPAAVDARIRVGSRA